MEKPEDVEGVFLDTEADTAESSEKRLIYDVNVHPPIHVTIVCALQHVMLSISSQLVTALLVAEVVCAGSDETIKARVLSSTLMMCGVTTIAMNALGIRLPLFQGSAAEYIIPLLFLGKTDTSFCTTVETAPLPSNNSIAKEVEQDSEDRIMYNLQALQGTLLVVGLIHAIVGMTGMVGLVLRFIGPLTVVPTLTMTFVFNVQVIVSYVKVHWGIATSTVAVAVILSLYLEKYKMPIPIWTPGDGCRVIRYPFHQVFSILISFIINWGFCGILTATGYLSSDPSDPRYLTRTDARDDIIYESPWFSVPYPGQWGPSRFSTAAFVSFLIAMLLSVIDSIGDYYACARVCRVPAPPAHAVNRGILIEGVCGILSGALGCGHMTNSYGGNIGAIGVTKVASRRVFLWVGIIYMLLAVFGKFCGVFVTIPHPVLGGACIVMYGIYFGVVLSNLEQVNLSSSRNITILGLSICIGLTVPTWAQATEEPVNTGINAFDEMVDVILKNPNFLTMIIAFFLDNTVPGSLAERGKTAWSVPKDEVLSEEDKTNFVEGYEVYSPLLPERVLNWPIIRYVPFLPYRGHVRKHSSK